MRKDFISLKNPKPQILKLKAVLQRLPLMTWLHELDLQFYACSLPANLSSSLRDLTLVFHESSSWDSSVIPLVQQLPGMVSIRIRIDVQHTGDLSLDHDLRPFLAMKSLRRLQLGDSQVWRANALRQLGELEAEVVRPGKRLELRY